MATDRVYICVRALSSGTTRLADLRTTWATGTLLGVDITGGKLWTQSTSAPLPVVHVAICEVTEAQGAALLAVMPSGTIWERVMEGRLEVGETLEERLLSLIQRILRSVLETAPVVAP